MKKLLSLLLVVVTLLGILPASAFAADSVEAALGEVDIYNGGYELGYLSINGAVKKQDYTYFMYKSNDGTTKEIPAYCVNPYLKGVPQKVEPGQSIKYLAEERSSDPKVVGIISNGYPHRSLGELKLDNKYQAYYATKMALWCYLIPSWNINNLKVAPGLTGAELDRGNRILAAAKDIYKRGTTYNYMLTPKMTATPDHSVAYPVSVEGKDYAELPKFQECIRRVRKAGGKVNNTCGIHVHVDASNHNRQSLKNLLGIMYSKEDILFKALRVNSHRIANYCQKVREPMLQKARQQLSAEETTDLTQLERIWYEGNVKSNEHYNWTRYYALNLHSVFFRGTVEFRCFNSTLHAGRAAAYVNLCLAMSAQAIAQRSTVMRKTQSDNELFTFRVWLVRLGLNGPEFKHTRDHLLANLDGDRAWRYDKDSYDVNKKKKNRSSEVAR